MNMNFVTRLQTGTSFANDQIQYHTIDGFEVNLKCHLRHYEPINLRRVIEFPLRLTYLYLSTNVCSNHC